MQPSPTIPPAVPSLARPAALLALVLLLAAPSVAAAQSGYFFSPDESFDEAIPSPEAFLGYEIGTHHTRHDRIVSYFQELARLSDRVTYQEIGRTVEHRVMPVITITNPENHARLEEIRLAHLEQADPGGAPDSDRPVIVHLGYGVHGNEASSSEAAMLTAYWLAAGEGADVTEYVERGVFHVEPVLNPDGRDRHTHWANMHKADPVVTDPRDREHDEVWPGGRTNHYWFDLNRDWLPLEHPESRARIDFHHAWKPNVVTDYHEMGSNSTYFFEPSKPVGSWNPLIPEELYTEITIDFADRWAATLDSIGALYFTKEVYDNTYPGYGSTYPNFLGGLGLVFEQAGSRGIEQESSRHGAGTLTFAYGIRNHFRTSRATVRAAVEDREGLFGYQRDFYRSALEEASADPVDAWIFGDPDDASLNREFLDLLLRHRLEVFEVSGDVEAEGRSFEEGISWAVPAEQPGYRLARSIFEHTDTFADSVFYDASTWTMSLAYGIPHAEVTGGAAALGARVSEVPPPEGLGTVPEAGYAYLLDWGDYYAPRALQYLVSRGVHAEAAMEPFTARTNEGERAYPRGSISIPVTLQDLDSAELHELVREAEERAGVRLQATGTGYSLEGVDLGSGNLRPVPEPRVLMVVGDGASSYEAGQIWHLLDTRVDLPVTKIDASSWGRAALEEYDVVVLVSGAQRAVGGADDLQDWVRGGGTLVALRSAARWAIDQGFAPRVAEAEREADAGDADDADPPARRDYADASAIGGAQQIGGSIYEADLDITHPIAFGYQRRSLPVWRDHSYILPPSANPYSTVAALTDDPHLSGYVSDPNLERLRGAASLLADGVGGGSVILFLDNPNFRGYWYGTNRLFVNALYFGGLVSVP